MTRVTYVTRLLTTFQFNERAKKLADPASLDKLLSTSCQLFQQVHNHRQERLGIRFLEREQLGSSNLSFWPATFGEIMQLKETDFPLNLDQEKSTAEGKENFAIYQNVPMQIRYIYQSFMRMNDIRRKKKMRSIRAIQGKKA